MPHSDIHWRKPQRSSTGDNCVEVGARSFREVAIRDSKAPRSGMLTVGRTDWHALIDTTRADRFY